MNSRLAAALLVVGAVLLAAALAALVVLTVPGWSYPAYVVALSSAPAAGLGVAALTDPDAPGRHRAQGRWGA
ncbi:hypothetical protein [Salininema proteolyticum]|uniref:Uncharacterized protein n=1 Tax=Salininema proteolyticum TaxID=1607685 RepID=A0ABV8TTM2_9ACTN